MNYTTLRGVNNYTDSLLDTQLCYGLQYFFDWGTLNVGGFQNVSIPQQGIYGGTEHRLRLVNDPNYTAGQVWESFRKNWVWETGVTYQVQPTDISGIYVNSTFYPKTTTGAYKHIIDYNNGQIIFDTPIATGSSVTLNYAYKRVFYTYADNDWYKRFKFESLKFTGNQFDQTGSGVYNELAQTRVQMPAVVLQVVRGDSPGGYELGHNSQYMYRDVLFNVIAESEWERDNLVSLIQLQNHKTINLINLNTLSAQNKFPLKPDGSRSSGAMIYPDMVNPNNGLVWRSAFLTDSVVMDPGVTNYGFYMGLVKTKVEVIV